MSRVSVLATFGLLAITTVVAAQGHPDFAGSWAFIHEGAEASTGGAFGEKFVATQYSNSLIIDWTFVAQGRSGKEVRAAHSAFIFNGTESNVTDIFTTGSHSQIVDTSTWDDQKLVVSTTWRGNIPARVTMKRIIWLDSDGILAVEMSKPPDGGGPWSVVRGRYRRITAPQIIVNAGLQPRRGYFGGSD